MEHVQMDSILNYYGSINSPFLHAFGKAGTNLLRLKLDCQKGEKILEVGFGTSATLVSLSSEFPDSKFYGVEYSQKMLDKAINRISFCGLSEKIKLDICSFPYQFPYSDMTFDKVYVESVIAIQEGNNPDKIISEINRILKPGGFVIINETLWMEQVEKSVINRINRQCKEAFGIIQCSEIYPYFNDWLNLFETNGFIVNEHVKLDEVELNYESSVKDFRSFLSFLFSLAGKIKGYLDPATRKNGRFFKIKMREIMDGHQKLMEGIIIKAQKIKQS